MTIAPDRPKSVFARYEAKAYPHNFGVTLYIDRIAGGTPTDPKVAEGWLKTKLGEATNDDLIRAQVAETMAERGISAEEAVELVNTNRHLNGFKRYSCSQCPPTGSLSCKAGPHELYIEGRQVKAAIKEAANVRWPKNRWGPSNKGTLSFFAEHVFVQEDRIPLGANEPTEISQRFVHTWRGSGIQYEEILVGAKLNFTVATDYAFTAEQWGLLWNTGQQQGIGATRSQGFGRYVVTRWESLR